MDSMRFDDDYDEDYEDDYLDDEDDMEEDSYSSGKSYRDEEDEAPRRFSKVTPMRSSRKSTGSIAAGMEVCVIKPTSIEEAREVIDTLLANRTVVLNLEGLDVEMAQRIIDFVSGSAYAIKGHLQKISHWIFIITPKAVDISGDFPEVLTTGAINVNQAKAVNFR